MINQKRANYNTSRRLLQLQKEIPLLSRVASFINAHAYTLHKTHYRKASCYCKIKRRFREWGNPVWRTGIRSRSALPGGTGAPGGLACPRISPFFCTRESKNEVLTKCTSETAYSNLQVLTNHNNYN